MPLPVDPASGSWPVRAGVWLVKSWSADPETSGPRPDEDGHAPRRRQSPRSFSMASHQASDARMADSAGDREVGVAAAAHHHCRASVRPSALEDQTACRHPRMEPVGSVLVSSGWCLSITLRPVIVFAAGIACQWRSASHRNHRRFGRVRPADSDLQGLVQSPRYLSTHPAYA